MKGRAERQLAYPALVYTEYVPNLLAVAASVQVSGYVRDRLQDGTALCALPVPGQPTSIAALRPARSLTSTSSSSNRLAPLCAEKDRRPSARLHARPRTPAPAAGASLPVTRRSNETPTSSFGTADPAVSAKLRLAAVLCCCTPRKWATRLFEKFV